MERAERTGQRLQLTPRLGAHGIDALDGYAAVRPVCLFVGLSPFAVLSVCSVPFWPGRFESLASLSCQAQEKHAPYTLGTFCPSPCSRMRRGCNSDPARHQRTRHHSVSNNAKAHRPERLPAPRVGVGGTGPLTATYGCYDAHCDCCSLRVPLVLHVCAGLGTRSTHSGALGVLTVGYSKSLRVPLVLHVCARSLVTARGTGRGDRWQLPDGVALALCALSPEAWQRQRDRTKRPAVSSICRSQWHGIARYSRGLARAI